MNKDTVILLAEDDKGHAGLIMKNLKRAGIDNEMILFVNGQEVLDYLFKLKNNNRSFVLLLDIRMPKVDGLEVLRRVKADELLSGIPVIMVTTADEEGTIEECKSMGCLKYIVKPVNYDGFVKTIQELSSFIQNI